ncbi:conserved hypothetical protein [Tenacibaculum maritimum]|uniref:hypothetical protein n=1 Tax=Tenacibaculum maritimum TaxID=107401 RepID=UPI0012E6E5A6|nr:hypothetical protein [Tenacibaculum maritimum]CAA0149597.1 conserved hypothetical protein [Tenacibaculum maritimum]
MTININIPANWNDLTERQLKKLAGIFHSKKNKTQDVLVLFILLNIRWWQFKKIFNIGKVLRSVGISELKSYYTFLYEKQERTKFIKSIKVNGKRLFSPNERITNLNVDEFAHVEDLYLGWSKTKDIEYLHYLTAVLYREKNKKGKRLLFDKIELEERAKALSKINVQILLATVLTYQGCREYLYTQFPVVFPKTTKKTKTPNSSGFGKLILHLSGKKFGSHRETKTTNVYTFLSEFEEQLKKEPNA